MNVSRWVTMPANVVNNASLSDQSSTTPELTTPTAGLPLPNEVSFHMANILAYVRCT